MAEISGAPSFRDPAGHVVIEQDRVLRFVNEEAREDLAAFLATEVAGQLLGRGALVSTERLAEDHSVYTHELIPFPSYPYEWTPEMLHAAGALTLEIAEKCLSVGFGLKDASPYNVLFRGPEPVFVDVLSFERRDPRDATWLAYAQFQRNFALPLLAAQQLGITLDRVFGTRRDGIRPVEVYAWTSKLRRLLPPFLGSVSIPLWLARFQNERLYQPHPMKEDQARFILASLFRRLKKRHAKAQSANGRSAWSEYGDAPPSYTTAQAEQKRVFVEKALARVQPKRVLDIGCNTGNFSLAAADAGASVVAIDTDPVVVGKLWRRAHDAGKDVLPLVVDIARPSPGLGWRNSETLPFLDRARAGFDMVLMLALIHHLIVNERVPLEQILELAAELTNGHAIIEFIAPDDPMFHRLARGRDHLHAGLTTAVFEEASLKQFEIADKLALSGCSRTLYLLRKR